MIDNADGRVTVLHARHPKARKSHYCDECGRAIEPGEKYLVERFIFDGSANTHKTCRHCERVREWLMEECGGFLYCGVAEDIQEHVNEGWYGKGVVMLAAGIRRRWRKRDGRLWRVPSVPKTTHERVAA